MFQKPRIFVALWIGFIGRATIRFIGQRRTSPACGQVEGEAGFTGDSKSF
jgi:hypothetical protein